MLRELRYSGEDDAARGAPATGRPGSVRWSAGSSSGRVVALDGLDSADPRCRSQTVSST